MKLKTLTIGGVKYTAPALCEKVRALVLARETLCVERKSIGAPFDDECMLWLRPSGISACFEFAGDEQELMHWFFRKAVIAPRPDNCTLYAEIMSCVEDWRGSI